LELTLPIRHSRVWRCRCEQSFVSKTGIEVSTPGLHTLRHTCVQRPVDSGFSLKTIGDSIGHRTPDATRIHAKVRILCDSLCCGRSFPVTNGGQAFPYRNTANPRLGRSFPARSAAGTGNVLFPHVHAAIRIPCPRHSNSRLGTAEHLVSCRRWRPSLRRPLHPSEQHHATLPIDRPIFPHFSPVGMFWSC